MPYEISGVLERRWNVPASGNPAAVVQMLSTMIEISACFCKALVVRCCYSTILKLIWFGDGDYENPLKLLLQPTVWLSQWWGLKKSLHNFSC